jgi:hypothetical protein
VSRTMLNFETSGTVRRVLYLGGGVLFRPHQADKQCIIILHQHDLYIIFPQLFTVNYRASSLTVPAPNSPRPGSSGANSNASPSQSARLHHTHHQYQRAVGTGGGGGDKLSIPPASSFHITSSPRQYNHNLTVSVTRARSSGANGDGGGGGGGGGVSTLNSYPSDSSISSVHSSLSQVGALLSLSVRLCIFCCVVFEVHCTDLCSCILTPSSCLMRRSFHVCRARIAAHTAPRVAIGFGANFVIVRSCIYFQNTYACT